MAGLYLHIPFCKQMCGYCDFHRSVKMRLLPSVVEQMHAELEAEQGFLHDRQLRTIYFGGGTPSLLAPDVIQGFIDHASRLFDCSKVEEITVEVNPDDVTDDWVAALRHTGVNRVSMGIQSFDEEALRFMGRRHTATEAVEAVRRLQRAGYDNLSIDIIFGIDGFGGERLQKTLDTAISLDVQHISAYHLTIEENTRFGRMLSRGEIGVVDEECSEREFAAVHTALTQAGFDHYEVSNYALPSRRSRHNSSYWTGAEYLGIGPGAHSFAGDVRRWCEQSVEEYITAVEYGEERLSVTDRLNECVMTSLRRAEGLSLNEIERIGGVEARERIEHLAAEALRSGNLVRHEADGEVRLQIPPEKFLISDAVISTLFEA